MTTIQVTTPPCLVCGEEGTLTVSVEGLRRREQGALIQEAFPELSPAEREQLKLGYHPKCWDELFAPFDEEDEDELDNTDDE